MSDRVHIAVRCDIYIVRSTNDELNGVTSELSSLRRTMRALALVPRQQAVTKSEHSRDSRQAASKSTGGFGNEANKIDG